MWLWWRPRACFRCLRFQWNSTRIKNMHQACTRSMFLNAPNMVESRTHFLARLSSVFCNILHETATRQWIVNLALFRVCANVLLVSVLSTFLFSSIFVESEYATFSMVRAPHANSAIKKALFLKCRIAIITLPLQVFFATAYETFAGIRKICVRAWIWRVRVLTNKYKLESVMCDQHDGVRWWWTTSE